MFKLNRYVFESGTGKFFTLAPNLKTAKQRLARYLRDYHDTNYDDVKQYWKVKVLKNPIGLPDQRMSRGRITA